MKKANDGNMNNSLKKDKRKKKIFSRKFER